MQHDEDRDIFEDQLFREIDNLARMSSASLQHRLNQLAGSNEEYSTEGDETRAELESRGNKRRLSRDVAKFGYPGPRELEVLEIRNQRDQDEK